MKKDKAISILHAIQNDFLHSLDDGECENPDDASADAADNNRECIEALDMAIKVLSK